MIYKEWAHEVLTGYLFATFLSAHVQLARWALISGVQIYIRIIAAYNS